MQFEIDNLEEPIRAKIDESKNTNTISAQLRIVFYLN